MIQQVWRWKVYSDNDVLAMFKSKDEAIDFIVNYQFDPEPGPEDDWTIWEELELLHIEFEQVMIDA